jgi:hypothetical protein
MSNLGKKRGHRRPGVRAVRVVVELGWDEAVRLDIWRKGLTGSPERPEAMRRLIEQALPGSPHRGRRRRETAHKASAHRRMSAFGGKADMTPLQPSSQPLAPI